MTKIFTLAAFFSALEVTLATDSTNPNCRTVCPFIFMPVCAVDCNNYNNYNNFSNDCSRKGENTCSGTNYQVVHQGNCDCTSNSTCADNPDSPVCVYDPATGTKQTFKNACEVKAFNVCLNSTYRIESLGTCCPKACTREYMPVCAYDKSNGNFREFPNKCEFEAENDCPPTDCAQNQYGFFDLGDCSCYLAYTNKCDGTGPFCAYSHDTVTFRTFNNKRIMDAVNNCSTSNAHDFKVFLRDRPCY